jgi:hypothetical protein
LPHDQSVPLHAKIAGRHSHGRGFEAKGREKFLSTKIARNPLKRLDLVKEIQAFPTLINWVFVAKRPEPKKTQTGSTGMHSRLAKDPDAD